MLVQGENNRVSANAHKSEDADVDKAPPIPDRNYSVGSFSDLVTDDLDPGSLNQGQGQFVTTSNDCDQNLESGLTMPHINGENECSVGKRGFEMVPGNLTLLYESIDDCKNSNSNKVENCLFGNCSVADEEFNGLDVGLTFCINL